jgi:cobalamin synthase
VGALAVATVTLILSDAWRISASLDALRLAALTVLAISTAVVALIVEHGLWERARDRAASEQVTLFNITTLATIVLGVVSLYIEAFVVILPAAALLIDSSLLSETIHRSVGVSDYLKLDWLVCSLATVGGALGAALESDAAVREAAYAYRPENERVHA